MSDKDDEKSTHVENVQGGIVSVGSEISAQGDINVDVDKLEQQTTVGGDKTDVGDISDSKGVAIGPEAKATITEGSDAVDLTKVFDEIFERLDALEGTDSQEVADAKEIVNEIMTEAARGDDADKSFLTQRIRNLGRMGPDILEVVTATLADPATGLALVVRKIAERAREDAGLEPV